MHLVFSYPASPQRAKLEPWGQKLPPFWCSVDALLNKIRASQLIKFKHDIAKRWFILEHAKAFCTREGARKEKQALGSGWVVACVGFLAYRSAGIRLALQCLLALSAEENMRFHLFSKIRACSAAFCATTHPFPSALLGNVHSSSWRQCRTSYFCSRCSSLKPLRSRLDKTRTNDKGWFPWLSFFLLC